jgi:hypothetical protein
MGAMGAIGATQRLCNCFNDKDAGLPQKFDPFVRVL